ncbi:MAG: S9 family peptidase [Bacillota bacterium]
MQHTQERARPRHEFEQFFAIRRHQPTLAFSPDGRFVYFSSDISGQFNLWRVPVEGGWPDQLTVFEDRTVRIVAASPNSDRVVFLADRNGTEFWQLFALPAAGGWPVLLTPREDVRYEIGPGAISPDGSLLAYGGNEHSPTDVDVMVRELPDGEVRRVLSTGEYLEPAFWAPDGQRMTVVAARSNTDQDVYVLDVRTGAYHNVTPHEGQVIHLPGPWLPDGSAFLLATNRGREFTGLALARPGAPGELEWIYTPDWDVEGADINPDGETAAVVVNEGGYSRVRLLELPSGRVRSELPVPEGVVGALRFSPGGRYLALMVATPRRSGELYTLRMADGRLFRLTSSMLGGIPDEDLVVPELIGYPTFDGRRIPAWLYRPAGAGPGNPAPVVLSIHGGPEAQERPTYHPLYQYLLNRGIGVMAPNIRGSSGYGITYQRLIHRDWGGAELKDIEAAARYLQGLVWVDGSRLGVYGGSFGGFATLSAVTRLPQYWAAAVDIVGPSNLVTFAKSVPPTWRRFMKEWVGDPDEDREFLLQRSPITYVDQVRAPLLVIQGHNDPRVVKAESDQMVERLRQLGRTVEYVVFEDEGHGFTRRANLQRAYRLTADFFERFLLAG